VGPFGSEEGGMTIRVITGDCREVLKSLPDASVQCCVTSPPYYGLRDYGVSGQIGLEQSPDEFVAQLVAVFREVRRVLRDDGTLWLNLGDSYNNFRSQKGPGQAVHGRDDLRGKPDPLSGGRGWSGLKEKDLLMMPARVALALQADGWYLRSDIIWHKPNPMPESVTDRPTNAHEHVFLLTKSPRYFFDAEAVREQGIIPAGTLGAKGSEDRANTPGVNSRPPEYKVYDGTRNFRNVWTIATAPYPDVHFATFPPELAERCIKAGTSEKGCCANCGAPWARQTNAAYVKSPAHGDGSVVGRHYKTGANGWDGSGLPRLNKQVETTGWSPSCRCKVLSGTEAERGEVGTAPCTVLDPFFGAGTAGLVSDRLGRDCIGIELNPAYCAMARGRIADDAGMFAAVAAE
jgi:DNA modification methylase